MHKWRARPRRLPSRAVKACNLRARARGGVCVSAAQGCRRHAACVCMCVGATGVTNVAEERKLEGWPEIGMRITCQLTRAAPPQNIPFSDGCTMTRSLEILWFLAAPLSPAAQVECGKKLVAQKNPLLCTTTCCAVLPCGHTCTEKCGGCLELTIRNSWDFITIGRWL